MQNLYSYTEKFLQKSLNALPSPCRFMPKGSRRFSEDLAMRISPAQRGFLEKYAEERDIGICKAARYCIDAMMKKEGFTP